MGRLRAGSRRAAAAAHGPPPARGARRPSRAARAGARRGAGRRRRAAVAARPAARRAARVAARRAARPPRRRVLTGAAARMAKARQASGARARYEGPPVERARALRTAEARLRRRRRQRWARPVPPPRALVAGGCCRARRAPSGWSTAAPTGVGTGLHDVLRRNLARARRWDVRISLVGSYAQDHQEMRPTWPLRLNLTPSSRRRPGEDGTSTAYRTRTLRRRSSETPNLNAIDATQYECFREW